MNRKPLATLLLCIVVRLSFPDAAQSAEVWTRIDSVERQPLLAQIQRLQDALDHIGSPLPDNIRRELKELSDVTDDRQVAARVQDLLDPRCLATVSLRKDASLVVVPRAGDVELVEQGWRAFLIKVINEPELRVRLRIDSPQAKPLPHSPQTEVASRWLGLSTFEGQPLAPTLSGLRLEYRIVEVFSRDPGERSGRINFTASSPTTNGTSSVIADWRFDADTAGWNPMNQVELEVRNGSLVVKGTGVDPSFSATLKTPAEPGKLVLRFWARAEEPGYAQVFWWTDERRQPDGKHVVGFNLEPGLARLYEIPFSADGKVIGIRIDPNSRPCKMQIDWIELSYADRNNEWAGMSIPFKTVLSTAVTFRVIDDDDRPAMGCFEITDTQGRVYPPQSKRLAPDLFFQRQIYRASGETLQLPPGKYAVKCARGPETIPEVQTLQVTGQPATLEYRVRRWIDPSRRGYWSGDHHIHAAGCAHYENPTQGVHPPDMARHCMGEDLKVGCCLTWGPCFDFQKRFFTGKLDDNSKYPYLIRYDVEVSGFGSHASGHLNLLRLQQQIPPGGDSKEHWPTLGLNTLRWAKRQGAICGPAHSSIGLTRFVDRVPGTDGLDGANGLPNFNIPAFDGIGANEFIMNVTHQVPGPEDKLVPAVDFISTMNTDRAAELNMWYHVLNCGFRVRASGETDFPCVSGERVGLGRVYVKLDGPVEFDRWCDNLAAGRSYVSDGRTHLMEFKANTHGNPEPTELGRHDSELHLPEPGNVKFTVSSAALYDGERKLPVELIVNGFPVAHQEIASNGKEHNLTFEHRFEKSSWAAIRVFPSGHTNPFFVLVGDKPIRANRLSAEWCLRSVDECWKSKRNTYRTAEQSDAESAYNHARSVFQRIKDEHP